MPGPGILPGPVMGFDAFCDGAEADADGGSGPSPGPEPPSASGGPPI
jgi:hypothetical protein